VNTYDWYKKHISHVEDLPGYDPTDKTRAWEVLTHPERIAVGLIYEESKPSFESLVLPDREKPIASLDLEVDGPRLRKILDGFR
jgi:2-oxoglutarate ferredoxin oxidoreductase subunit beta